MRSIGFQALCGHTYIHAAAGSKSHLRAHAGSVYRRRIPKRTPFLGHSSDFIKRGPEVVLRMRLPSLREGPTLNPVELRRSFLLE